MATVYVDPLDLKQDFWYDKIWRKIENIAFKDKI